ncbi:hypothetical protein DVH24_034647 [Malus domestica]|uniref:TIR domain-containing protein n=1 Tax=Malus domestica TaxID=3750 RepID=A0A498IZQ7_MALDO|nr:hypothetical protein DVH24_034647 [Malus domestica]
MELIGFFQVFNIVVIAIGTLLYMYCRSLTFSSSTSSSGAADAAVDDNDDGVDKPPLREKYDVFISFRGEDTRLTFTSHLHKALERKKIETYIDYRLNKGDEIEPALLEAIEKSRLSVIIFSKNYASSTWCLKELVHILKCKKKDQMVVPIFYDISPSDVRKQKGSYADAFAQLENREDSKDKVIGWKAALAEATGLSGFDFSNKKGFYKFPEILEPMEHLKFLRLEGTAVEELPQSVGNLVGLQTLDLGRCEKLKVVPSSIYNLRNLKTLSFNGCWKLQNFPQPTGSVGLLSLEVLDLGESGILQIPEDLICLTSLLGINLNGTKIRSVPSTIKQASQLSCLFLIECTSLESLPELPVLSRLQADGCKSLMTVSSSMTAITQCWNRYQLLEEQLLFYNCGRLGNDADARSSIMVEAQLRIMRVATASSKLKEKEDYQKFSEPLVTIVCPGYEIPNWFVHQNKGASINVKLPANWFRKGFLGFALSVVASGHQDKSGKVASGRQDQPGMQFECKYNFKTEEGQSHGIDCPVFVPCKGGNGDGCNLDSKHVFVLYKDLEYEEGVKWSSDFYCRFTEVSVHFETKPFQYNYTVENCGICLLYAEDAEKLKFDV